MTGTTDENRLKFLSCVEHGIAPAAAVMERIAAGRVLLLAGEAAALAALPQGCWIGGTATHALAGESVRPLTGALAFTDLTNVAADATAHLLDHGGLREIGTGTPLHGFTVLILPGASDLLHQVAGELGQYQGLYNAPLIGWVSAGPAPQVFCGTGEPAAGRAAALHVPLPPELFAQLHIAHVFLPGQGETIEFTESGLVCTAHCLIGGVSCNLARYMAEHGISPRLPLIADSEGALVTLAIRACNPQTGTVEFLSPAQPGLAYRFSEPVADTATAFASALARQNIAEPAVACGCVLACAEGGYAGGAPLLHGPLGEGQIAYTLLNQTLACLSLTWLDATALTTPVRRNGGRMSKF
jgi:hypothetical protein